MSNWTPIKPKLKKECLLLTASRQSGESEWYYNSWWVKEFGDDGWYFALCTIEGDEWGDIDDLQADLYEVINLPK